MSRRHETGDTLVEVLLAIVILSIIIVGAISLMTFGITQTQTSVEHTQVRLQINGQSNILQYLRDDYVNHGRSVATAPAALWQNIITNYTLGTTPTDKTDDGCVVQGAKPFYLAQNAALAVTINNFNAGIKPATSAIPGQGLWLEAYKATASGPEYIDFVIRGCWQPTGSGPRQQEATVVRLYDGN